MKKVDEIVREFENHFVSGAWVNSQTPAHMVKSWLKQTLKEYGQQEYERGRKEALKPNAVDNDGNPVKIYLT
jgi:hypothetical protein